MEIGENGESGDLVASPAMKVYGPGLNDAIIRHQVTADPIVLDRQLGYKAVLIVLVLVRI